MALFGANLTDVKEIIAQQNALKEQEKRYLAAKEDYLKGRSINQAEQEAKSCIDNANMEAKRVQEEAVRIRSEAGKMRAESERLKEVAQSQIGEIKLKETAILALEEEWRQKIDAADRLKVEWERKVASVEAKDKMLSDRLSKIEQTLTGLLNG